MPLACDRDAILKISLVTDMAINEATRPVFLARHLPSKDQREFASLLKQAIDEKDSDKSAALLDKALAIPFTGWRNVRDRDGAAVEFKITAGIINFDDVLSEIDK